MGLAGDSKAWDELVDRYQALIYATLRRTGLTPADADDTFQDVCVLLFNHLGDLRDSARLSGWLIATARREAWRQLRRAGAIPISQLPGSDWKFETAAPLAQQETPAPDAEIMALEEQQLVRRALEQLAVRCRDLLTLLYLRDPAATYQEISESLSMPVGGIGPQRARCLQQLQKILANLGF